MLNLFVKLRSIIILSERIVLVTTLTNIITNSIMAQKAFSTLLDKITENSINISCYSEW